MTEAASQASALLRALANEDRLLILCHLASSGEMNVSELQEILQIRQPSLSQQLSRLRAEGLVTTRRNGKSIYYSLSSREAGQVIKLLYKLYCAPQSAGASKQARKRVGAA